MSMQGDLDRHVTEKFTTLLNDSVDLYRRADLPSNACSAHLAYLMMTGAVWIMLSNGTDDNYAHEMLDLIIKQARKVPKKRKGVTR